MREGIGKIRISSNLKINIDGLHCHKIEFFLSFASERNMEPPNLDFFGFELENFVVMFIVYRMGLAGKLVNYRNSTAVKYFR